MPLYEVEGLHGSVLRAKAEMQAIVEILIYQDEGFQFFLQVEGLLE